MKKYATWLPIVFTIVIGSCIGIHTKETAIVPEDRMVTLQWNKAYPTDSLKNAVKGLEWALSHIGAKQTKILANMTTGNDKIMLNVAQLGFDGITTQNLKILHHKLKATEAYQKIGAIDIGRYVTLLIGASEHYYKLVQLPESYFDLLAQYDLVTVKGYVNNSSISKRDRIIRFSDQEELRQLFVSEETHEETGKVIEYETIDIMPNGQLRFGIFDIDGKRKNSANPMDTEAGKPGKCMWCHESKIQPLFKDQLNYEGYLTAQKLADTLDYYRKVHVASQKKLLNGIDYAKKKEHTLMELLYITFMEPSAERLSLEWHLPIHEVKKRLSGLPTHGHHEFGDLLGPIYHRDDVEKLAPFTSLQVSSDVREKALREVDHLY